MGVRGWFNNLVEPAKGQDVERSVQGALSLTDWQSMFDSFSFGGIRYTLPTGTSEDIGGGFTSMARLAYKSDSVVFACMLVRQLVFSEARFMFRRLRDSRAGDLFGNADLQILNVPWSGGTTGDLLSRMIQHADLAGNAFVSRSNNELQVLRPDWVTIIAGSNAQDSTVWDVGARVLGYAYQEGGTAGGKEPVVFLPEEVAHFAPIPDPEARFRGMSWLTPLCREIMADKAMTEHKISFLENGATPNMVMKFAVDDLKKYKDFVQQFKLEHDGARNAYKTIFLAGGMDAVPVGSNFQQIDFKQTQGAGETRVAAAAGTPPIIVGLSEGLQGSSLNAGNYTAAKRRFADGTMRPLWRNAAGSLARIINVPRDAELWYDDGDITFLQEDQRDAADIQSTRSQSIKTLLDAGYTAESVVAAITNEDFTLLQHSGLFSVQLQPPGSQLQSPGNPQLPAAPAQKALPAVTGGNSNRDVDAEQVVEALLASLTQTEG